MGEELEEDDGDEMKEDEEYSDEYYCDSDGHLQRHSDQSESEDVDVGEELEEDDDDETREGGEKKKEDEGGGQVLDPDVAPNATNPHPGNQPHPVQGDAAL